MCMCVYVYEVKKLLLCKHTREIKIAIIKNRHQNLIQEIKILRFILIMCVCVCVCAFDLICIDNHLRSILYV